jgi:YD repeat-containing protein
MIDPYGNTNTVFYDSTNGVLRVRGLVDSLGQTNWVYYDNPGDLAKITEVTDPFNRSARFTYDNTGRLTAITDVIGITSQFSYDDADSNPTYISTLTTPYGTTTFGFLPTANQSFFGQGVIVTDPLGQQEQVVAYLWGPSASEPTNEVPPGFQNANDHLAPGYAISYFWDKEAMKEGSGDYTKAKKYAFFKGPDAYVSGVKYFEKNPLENPVWYAYPGEGSIDYFSSVDQATTVLHPSAVARVLDDGTTQLYSNEYNSALWEGDEDDRSHQSCDFEYSYAANGIDLVRVQQADGQRPDDQLGHAGKVHLQHPAFGDHKHRCFRPDQLV